MGLDSSHVGWLGSIHVDMVMECELMDMDDMTFEEFMEMKKKDCAECGAVPKYVVEDTPLGGRSFCSEKCFCKWMDLEYNGDGYYGLGETIGDEINGR